MKYKENTTCRYGNTVYPTPSGATKAAVRDWFTAGGANEPHFGEEEISIFLTVLNDNHWPLPNLQAPFTESEVRQLIAEAFRDVK